MCACQDPAFCHRSTIAEKLLRAGLEVTELNESRPVQYQQLELI